MTGLTLKMLQDAKELMMQEPNIRAGNITKGVYGMVRLDFVMNYIDYFGLDELYVDGELIWWRI